VTCGDFVSELVGMVNGDVQCIHTTDSLVYDLYLRLSGQVGYLISERDMNDYHFVF